MHHSTLCPACRHPMLELRTFDGASSADAPKFGGNESPSFGSGFDWPEIVFRGVMGIGGVIVEETKSALRKYRARNLRAAIMPDYPFSLVCPLCLEIVRRTGRP